MTVPLGKIFIFLDSCAIDSKDSLEKLAIDRIYLWQKTGAIVDISPSVQEEVNHPNTPTEVKRIVNKFGCTPVRPDLNEEEKKCLNQIKKILAGNGNVRIIQKDAENIFEAYKNAANYKKYDWEFINKGALSQKRFYYGSR